MHTIEHHPFSESEQPHLKLILSLVGGTEILDTRSVLSVTAVLHCICGRLTVSLPNQNMISMIRPLGKRPAPGSRPKVLILPSYFEEFLAVRLSSKRTAAWQNRFSGYTVKRRGAV